MAKAKSEDSITYRSIYISWYEFLEDIFYKPHFAFESFLQKSDIGGRDLWKLHLSLSLLGPLAKFSLNLGKSFFAFLTTRSPVTSKSWLDGVLSIWMFYLGMILLVRFADIFRVYYKRWDRTKDWNEPVPWILMIGFLPFTASGIFFLFPIPVPLLFVLLAFLYSLHISYHALVHICKWDSKEFFIYLLQLGIFSLLISGVLLAILNLVRMIRS